MKQKPSAPAAILQPAPTIKKILFNNWYYIGLLVVIAIVFFNKVIFGQAFFWEDLIYQEFPHRLFARDMLLSGQFPHWNPYTFGGMPFFAAIHTGVLYPSNLLLSLLPVSNDAFWYLLELGIILHLIAAGTGTFLLSRVYKTSRSAALFAAISYMLCGFFVVHIIHSLMIYILAWLPFVMILLKRGIEQNKTWPYPAAGLLLGITILAGHPQITFYEFLFLGAFCIYLFVNTTPRKPIHIAFMALTFGLAGGLAMVQLLPAAELSGQSARVVWTFEAATEGSMSIRQLITFIIPKLFGGTNAGNTELAFWLKDAFHSGYWTFWETTFYTGLPILLLGIIGLRRFWQSPFKLFVFCWAVFCLIVALGNHTPFYQLLFNHFPGFDKFRIPARIFVTLNLLLPLMAACTLDELANRERFKKLFKIIIIGCGALFVIGLSVSSGFIAQIWPEFLTAEYMNYARKQSNTLLIMTMLTALPVVLYFFKAIDFKPFKLGMISVLIVDLFVFGMNYHIVEYSAPQYYARSAQASAFFKNASAQELMRINMRKGGAMLVERNAGMIDKVQLLEGYNPLNLFRRLPPTTLPASEQPDQRQIDLLNVRYFITVDYQRGQMGLGTNPAPLPRAALFYKYRVFDNDTALKYYMLSDSFAYRKELALEKNPALAMDSTNDSTTYTPVSITKYSCNRIEMQVSSPRNALLFLSEVWYPAWEATIDGKKTEILRADWCLRAVPVTKGNHTIIFEFKSTAFKKGLLVSIIALLAGGVWLTVALGKRRDKS